MIVLHKILSIVARNTLLFLYKFLLVKVEFWGNVYQKCAKNIVRQQRRYSAPQGWTFNFVGLTSTVNDQRENCLPRIYNRGSTLSCPIIWQQSRWIGEIGILGILENTTTLVTLCYYPGIHGNTRDRSVDGLSPYTNVLVNPFIVKDRWHSAVSCSW